MISYKIKSNVTSFFIDKITSKILNNRRYTYKDMCKISLSKTVIKVVNHFFKGIPAYMFPKTLLMGIYLETCIWSVFCSFYLTPIDFASYLAVLEFIL